MSAAPVVALPFDCPEEDGLVAPDAIFGCAHLPNSGILKNLDTYLEHLSEPQRVDLIGVIELYPTLFSDTPSQTTFIKHDIDVGDSPPIKQHHYRVNPRKRELMKKEVDYLLRERTCCSQPKSIEFTVFAGPEV